MNIAILGGSFDPPHLGHALIAQQVKERLAIDEVWLMPCFGHTFQKNLSGASDRLAMTKFLETEHVLVSDFEIQTKSRGATIETLGVLTKKFPQHRFSWIVGSDQLPTFHKWDRWQELVKNYNLIVFPREIALPNLLDLAKKAFQLTSLPKNIILMDAPDLLLTNVSSSGIRKRVRSQLPIDLLVPEAVVSYIRKHKLYV